MYSCLKAFLVLMKKLLAVNPSAEPCKLNIEF